MKKYLSLMAFAMFGLLLTGCGSNSSNSKQYEKDMSNNKTTESEDYDETKWNYIKHEDDLTHNTTGYTAYIVSTNRAQIDSYGNTAKLCISLKYSTDFSSTPSTSVLISFMGGNERCRFSDFQGSGFLAVFDNGEVDNRWGLIDMGSKRNWLSMHYSSKVDPFVEKLKSSKQARIQVNLENVGRTTFDFNVEGLQWDW